jgi:hypothetical protein
LRTCRGEHGEQHRYEYVEAGFGHGKVSWLKKSWPSLARGERSGAAGDDVTGRRAAAVAEHENAAVGCGRTVVAVAVAILGADAAAALDIAISVARKAAAGIRAAAAGAIPDAVR